jgi:hypothetical protein
MVDLLLLYRPPQGIQAFVLAAARAIPMTTVLKYGLINRFQRPFDRLFNDLVFKIADSKRSALLTARFRNIAAAFRPRTVAHPLQPCRQIPKILFEISPVFLLCYAIHSGRLLGVQCVVAGTQVVHIADVVVQAGKYQARLLACPFTYPRKFRSHYNSTPCIVPMFPFLRTTNRGDLRSAGISRFIARPLRLSGPHHSRRGHPLPSFYIGQGTRVLPLRTIPQELLDRRSPGYLPVVVQLDAVLDPGGAGFALVFTAFTAWPAPQWRGSAHSQNHWFSGLRVRFRATPFTS